MKYGSCTGRLIFLLLCILPGLTACGSGGSSFSSSSETDPDPIPVPTLTYQLSGSVVVDRDSDVDDDVSRVNVQNSNNDINNPQPLGNPVTLGGYVSGLEGCYSNDTACASNPFAGPSFLPDSQDFFRVSLVENQQVTLSVFFAEFLGASLGDIDVSLYLRPETDTSQVTESLTFEGAATKKLTVSEAGTYIIEVNATEGLSAPVLYTLSLSNTVSGASLDSAKLSAKFVPGEVIVKFKGENQTRPYGAAASVSKQSLSKQRGLKTKRSLGKIAQLYGIETAALNRSLSFESAAQGEQLPDRLKKKWQTLKTIEALRAREDVIYAEPNYIRHATAIPNDPEYDKQWSLPMLGLPAAWEVSTGSDVIVAVIDTGIDPDHVDLSGKIVAEGGYDFIEDIASAGDGDGPDTDPRDQGTTYHGSHVAGIIAAAGDNSRGITGVAYDASIMPLRVLGVNGEGTDTDIVDAIMYAAGLSNSSGLLPAVKADIINLSLGSLAESDVITDAVNSAIAEGVIVIAAAGNDSTDDKFWPAAVPDVIAVSSVTDNKTLSSFSNYGEYIDVAAPGGTGINDPLFDGFQDGILSTVYASEYAEMVGTSMAAPHVSGVVALMKSVEPTLTPASFATALNSGGITDTIGLSRLYGRGLINAAKAMAWLNQEIPAFLSVFPNQLGFVGANTEASLSLTNPGNGVVAATIQSYKDWIEVVPVNIDAEGLGDYTIKVDVSGFDPNSIETAVLYIRYRINGGALLTYELNVFVSNSQQTENTVGQLWVYLIPKAVVDDASNQEGEIVVDIYAPVEAVLNDGVYRFTLNNIPPGQYYLEASTDADGDGLVFDNGEARGAYPVFSKSELVNISDRNISGLNFDVGYPSFAESSGISLQQTSSAPMPLVRRRRATPSDDSARVQKIIK